MSGSKTDILFCRCFVSIIAFQKEKVKAYETISAGMPNKVLLLERQMVQWLLGKEHLHHCLKRYQFVPITEYIPTSTLW